MDHKDKPIQERVDETRAVLQCVLDPLKLLSPVSELSPKNRAKLEADTDNVRRLLKRSDSFPSDPADLKSLYLEIVEELQRIHDDILKAVRQLYAKTYAFSGGSKQLLTERMTLTGRFLLSTDGGYKLQKAGETRTFFHGDV